MQTSPGAPGSGASTSGRDAGRGSPVVVLLALLAALACLAGAPTARAAGQWSGAIDPSNGFPTWYQDAAGNRLAQCIDANDGACVLAASDSYDPALPLVFPKTAADCATAPVDPAACNFPDEFFYALADAGRVPTPGCGALSAPGFALLRVALEGAFGTLNGMPAPGQQIAFARTRVVVKGGLCPNTAYTFRTPFADFHYTTDATGGIKAVAGTQDVGCLAGATTACDFSSPLSAALFGTAADGGFLRSTPAPLAGALGDGATVGALAGGTNGNAFSIIAPGGAVVATTASFTAAGRVAGPIGVTPGVVDFAGQADGTASAPKTVTLRNLGSYPGNGPTTISAIAVGPGSDLFTSHPEEFTLSALPAGCSAIARDGACAITVTFHPAAAAQGRRTADLLLTTDGFGSPQHVRLTGSAVNAAAVPQAVANPTSVAFGSVRIRESSSTKTVTISNPAGPDAAPVTIADVNVTGTDAARFPIIGSTCSTGTVVDPGRTCVISLRFSPFGTGAGPMNAVLNVISDAADPTPPIGLTGTATGGRAAVSPTISAFDGYPDWYMAEDGAKLVQCIDPTDPYCVVLPDAGYNGTPPLHFLDDPAHLNFPTEFFYEVATSDNVALPGCDGGKPGRAFIRTAIEGAFTGLVPVDGDQIVFGRTRIVVRGGLCANTTYTFTHPYGELQLTTDGSGAVKPNAGTSDVGCLAGAAGVACDFTEALASPVLGATLRWDPAEAPAAPTGYLGDAATLHGIVGAPYAPGGVPANYFRISHIQQNPDTGLPEEVVDGQTSQFTVMGKLQGPLEADASTVGFGTVVVPGGSRSQAVVLTNTGVDPILISSISTAGADAAEFTASAACEGRTLAPGASCSVSVSFDPAAVGTRTARLHVVHSGFNDPLDVDLTGIGSANTAAPNISFSPRGLSFAPVHVDANSPTTTLTIANAGGGATLTINGVVVQNDAGGAFTIVDDRCVPEAAPGVPTGDPGFLAPNASCQVDVVFDSGAAGTFTARIHVDTPDFPASDPTTMAALSGIASSAAPGVAASVDAGNGFPRWFRDGNGVQLQPCLTTAGCVLLGDAGFNPASPVAFPANFPSEFFYAVADTPLVSVTQDCGGGVIASGTVGARLALEGSFAGGTPAAGQQIAFGRVRIIPPRGAGGGSLCPNTAYTFVTPFGPVGPITTDANGTWKVNLSTFDVGCGAAPCTFADALASPVATSFLRWDPNVAPAAPAGTLGDAVSFHRVTGGTYQVPGTNRPFNGFQVLTGGTVLAESDTFLVAGRIAGPLQADAATAALGSQPINLGATAPQTITFRNITDAPVTVGAAGAEIVGVDQGDFLALPAPATTCQAGAVVPVDGTCDVQVVFDPGTAGAKTATLRIAPAGGTAVTVALSGTGLPAAVPVVTPAPTSLGFGNVTTWTTSPAQTLTIRNDGNADLLIGSATRTGASAADVVLTTATPTPCIGVAVAPGQTCTIQVQLRPSGIGARTASITLAHNPAGPAQVTSTTISVSGTGIGSVLGFTSSTIKFGTVNRGTTQDQTITLKNTGNAPALLTLASFTATGTGYVVRSTTCATLNVNSSCNVVVRFTAPNAVATFNGTLQVTAPNAAPLTASTALTATTR